MKPLSRTARRIFRPVVEANGPAKLDLRGVEPFDAWIAIHEASDRGLIRVLDGPPLAAMYVITDVGPFYSRFDRLYARLRLWLASFGMWS